MVEDKMYQLATDLIKRRYPKGWGGAAVIRTENDNYYTSVAIETANSSAVLCIEVGAMCEAHKYNEKVTHCFCIARDIDNEPFMILLPCGICQERLRYWGDEVLVGVTYGGRKLKFVTLKELTPFHWTMAYTPDELEHFIEEN